jgi:type IV secretion system protein VirB4
MFEGVVAEFHRLNDDETLSYLKRRSRPAPQRARAGGAAFPRWLLCDAPLVGGIAPMLGSKHLRVLTIKGFPPFTHPGVLDDLSASAMTWRWMTRFLCLGREEAERELVKWRRLWFSKHKSMGALVKEMLTKEAATFANPDAIAKSEEVDEALAGAGLRTGRVRVPDVDAGCPGRDARGSRRKTPQCRAHHCLARVCDHRGESQRSGSLALQPCRAMPTPMCATRWSRPSTSRTSRRCRPRGRATPATGISTHPALAVARTDGSTPFRLDLHVGDVGHTMVVGPTGAGKSVLLSFLALQWRRFAGSKVFVFDKGGSARAALLGMGGTAIDLGGNGVAAFQPLARIDIPKAAPTPSAG